MSSQPTDIYERACAYIDEIMAINRRTGMGDQIPEDVYEDAVRDVARASSGLRSATT